MAKVEMEKEEIRVPGTMVLVFVFLAWFAAFYFFAWQVLSQGWIVR